MTCTFFLEIFSLTCYGVRDVASVLLFMFQLEKLYSMHPLQCWRVFRMPFPRSLIRWMCLSTSGTFSFAAAVFMTRMGIRTLGFSNLLSISTVPTWNIPRKYRSMMHLMPAASCLAVQDGVCSAINRFMPREMLTRNGTPLTNITSVARVTHWCCTRIALGILT